MALVFIYIDGALSISLFNIMNVGLICNNSFYFIRSVSVFTFKTFKIRKVNDTAVQ